MARSVPADWRMSSMEHAVFDISIRASAAEIVALGPDRAAAFFAGVAKVIALPDPLPEREVAGDG